MTDVNDIPPVYSPYVEVSLDNLLHNLERIRAVLPPKVDVLAVVKDCSYGCGSIEIAKTLECDGGVRFFAVARASEAFALRKSGVARTALVFGPATDEELRFGADKDILFAFNDIKDAERFRKCGVGIRCHLNIDTGMGRLGIQPSEVSAFIEALKGAPNVHLDGVFTHMACADEPDTLTVNCQLEKFTKSLEELRAGGLSPACVHYGNSAAFLRFPVEGCTHVRPGIALYGCRPDPAQEFGIDLKPVASLISRVVKMKKVPAGTPISYGGNYVTSASTWIATVALGYAHGLPRFLSNRGEVLIKGKRYRIAGNVTMDCIMIDAGHDPAISVGDEVVAIGSQGGETITPDDIAVIGGTIGYEVICNLGTAIERVYIKNGRIVRRESGVIF